MYRSTQHSTTLKTPAELMFNRNIRDKLPSIEQPLETIDSDTRDRDMEKKWKVKLYADSRRRAQTNPIKEGDKVVVKRQIVTNKLATTFEPEIHKVTKRFGSEVVVEHSGTGKKYRRNVSHVKKISSDADISLQPSSASLSQESQPAPIRLSSCKRIAPSHYQDYQLAKRPKRP